MNNLSSLCPSLHIVEEEIRGEVTREIETNVGDNRNLAGWFFDVVHIFISLQR